MTELCVVPVNLRRSPQEQAAAAAKGANRGSRPALGQAAGFGTNT